MIKLRLGFTRYGPGAMSAQLKYVAKFIQCLPNDLASFLWIAGVAFAVNRQLLICLVAMPRISRASFQSSHANPKSLFPLRESRE
jgi:hypothetical protein